MPEAKFTAGPYTTYRRSDNGYNLYAGETMIADVDAAQFSRQKQVHSQTNKANAALFSAAPDLYEALECAADAEEIRQYIVLGDEFHRLCDKWRTRAEELLSEEYPMTERLPGWVGGALRELSQKLRAAALAKARGEAPEAE